MRSALPIPHEALGPGPAGEVASVIPSFRGIFCDRASLFRPRRVLMTADAVGGVWRYAVDLAGTLNASGIGVVLVCLGPAPSVDKAQELKLLPATRLISLDQPLDWQASGPGDLSRVPERIVDLAEREGADLLHLNLPTQAAGMVTQLPVVVMSHSCVVTWWRAMRGQPLPEEWGWQFELNRRGLARADAVAAPTQAHAEAVTAAYGLPQPVRVVPNSVKASPAAVSGPERRERFVFAAARWWDESKNAAVLDAAATLTQWPIRTAGACSGGNGQSFHFRNVQAEGELPAAAVRAMMRRAGIFVSPSRYEPFGLAALEAAEAGAAPVLADIPTYRELWSGAARFVPADDPEAFARAVDELAADDRERTSLGAAARRRASGFSPQRQLTELLSLYEAAAQSTPRVERNL